ncbi:MAG: hypothetical protein R2861_02530 [Desulfobacterales bacterium]
MARPSGAAHEHKRIEGLADPFAGAPYAVLTAGLMGWRYNDMGLLAGAGILALSTSCPCAFPRANGPTHITKPIFSCFP